MRGLSAAFIIAAMVLGTITLACAEADKSGNYLDIKDVTMHLKDGNATFDLNYTLDPFTKLYVLALGCRYLEPELKNFLGGYTQATLIKADTESATLQVQDAGKYSDGYFLFDSTHFWTKENPHQDSVARFSVVYPEGRTRTFYNVTSTQNVFSRAEKTPVDSNKNH